MSISPLISVLYVGYEKDSDAWASMQACFHLNWSQCPYPLFFCSVTTPLNDQAFTCLQSHGDGSFSTRLSFALNYIKTPYVIILMHDFIITEPVQLTDCLEWERILIKENPEYLQLGTHFLRKLKGKKIQSEKDYCEIPIKRHYRLCLQPAIWKVSFVKDVISNENLVTPQDFEVFFENKPEGHAAAIHAKALVLTSRQLKIDNLIESTKVSYSGLAYLKCHNLPFPQNRLSETEGEYKKSHRLDQARQDCPYWVIKIYKKIGRLFGKHYFTD